LPEPIAEPEPELPPDIAPEPPSINDVNLESLAPSTPVTLDNGVVVTAEVAIAVALLQDPGALLEELFTDPAAAFAALGSVGADLPPEVRERAEEVVIASVIVGNIATSAAATAAAGAAYRRKP
jgi:ABC-type arginine transport system ATPase subunit